ncbi:MAG TPA: four helix bundle protein [Gemmatimonadales bacterium]|nr:four helix bundle protein [Gemmatimonadales bacterium]
MGDYRDLEAWRSSQDLAVAIYELTQTFPAAERFGITSQMRRAAVSVMSNIAEGAGRGTDRQLEPFLRIARGSLHELESQCQLAQRLGFCSPEETTEALRISDRTGRQLYRLLRSLSHD